MIANGIVRAVCVTVICLASFEALAIQYRVYWTAACTCNGGAQKIYAGFNTPVKADSVKAVAARCAGVSPDQINVGMVAFNGTWINFDGTIVKCD
jgi:hypothetical protein